MLISPPPRADDWPARQADLLPMPVGGRGLRSVAPGVATDDRQYAVLVVSESQLDSLLGRPAMRHLNPRLLATGRTRARRWPWVAGAATALVTLGVLAGAWLSAPGPVLASVLPGRVLTWTRPPAAPPLLTGAGFTLAVGAPRSADAAAAVAGRLENLGLPGFVETAADGAAHQVLVGPYASLDEAEAVQRRVGRAGFGTPRLAVDDGLRHAGLERGGAVPGEIGVVLVGAGGRVSLVLELAMTPRQVIAQQASDTVLDVDIGPVAPGVAPREWTAPPGVHLVEHVTIEEGAALDGEASLRARLTIPRAARATARVEGRRVYVDLAWPEAVRPASRARTTAVAGGPALEREISKPAAVPPAAADIELLRAGLVRFSEIAPFLISSAASPSSEILGALDGTLAELGASLQGARVPAEAASSHGLLQSAIASARRAADPLAPGDRQAHAHQAVGLFEAARAGMPAR